MLKPEEFYPKSFLVTEGGKILDDKFDQFTQYYRINTAESLVKTLEGEPSLQDYIALKICEKRLTLANVTVDDAEWIIL